MNNLVSLFSENPWAFWVLVAVGSAIAEVSLPSFTFIFGSLAAIVATAAAVAGASGPVQIMIFAAALVASMWLLRPRFISKVSKAHHLPSRAQALHGAQGQTTEAIDSTRGTGRVLVAGEDWSARSSTLVPSGKTIVVTDHDGIVLIVKEI